MKGKVVTSNDLIGSSSKETNGRKKIAVVIERVEESDSSNSIDKYICSTCCYKESCLFLRAAKQPIFQCEEFSNEADQK